jgi:acetyl-CoA carboxylase biotin carboxyl carrier protein
MMDLDFVQSLIKALDESGLDTIEIERGATSIRLSKTPSSVAAAAPAALAGLASSPVALAAPPPPAQEVSVPSDAPASADSGLTEITSPMVGTFYRAPAPDARSYIEMGANVSPGDTLCIIEAMKLMNELECEVTGVIREICVENGDPIEYGQVLFRVSPS